MNLAAVFHRPVSPWCHACDPQTLVIRLQTAAGEAEQVTLLVGDPFDWTHGPLPPGGAHLWNFSEVPMGRVGSTGIHDWWEARWQPPFRRARYSFRIRHKGRDKDYGEQGFSPVRHPETPPDFGNSFNFAYLHKTEVLQPPAWVQDTVWYQIFPDRYYRDAAAVPGRNPLQPWKTGPVSNREFYGGTLRGITEKLDHIRSLGFTGLYLTPIFASPSVHKYDTEDYALVDPDFGTEEDLKDLVTACHEKGMKILLDGVFNHCGQKFAPWLDVLEKGPGSPYADWFHIESFPQFPGGRDTGDRRDASFETFAFTTRMPKLNTTHPEVREYLLNTVERWTRVTGIDGWRLDVANEVDHAFWKEFRRRVKAVNPQAYLVGEIWQNALPWLQGDEFDATMNYPYSYAVLDFLQGKPRVPDGSALGHRLLEMDMATPEPAKAAQFNLLDSHDTERLLHRLGGQKALARLGWFLLPLLPGTPCFYYGSEVGLEGGGDPDNRRCMPWEEKDQDKDLLGFFRKLLDLFHRYRRVWKDGMKSLAASPDHPGLFGWAIGYQSQTYLFLVQRDLKPLNGSELRESLGLELPGTGTDLWTGLPRNLDQGLEAQSWLAWRAE